MAPPTAARVPGNAGAEKSAAHQPPFAHAKGAGESAAPLMSEIVSFSGAKRPAKAGASTGARTVSQRLAHFSLTDDYEVVRNGTRLSEAAHSEVAKVKFYRDAAKFNFKSDVFIVRHVSSGEVKFCYQTSDGLMHDLSKKMLEHYVAATLRMTPAQIIAARNKTPSGDALFVPTSYYALLVSEAGAGAEKPVARPPPATAAAPLRVAPPKAGAVQRAPAPSAAKDGPVAVAAPSPAPAVTLDLEVALSDVLVHEMFAASTRVDAWNAAFAKSGHGDFGRYVASNVRALVARAATHAPCPAQWRISMRDDVQPRQAVSPPAAGRAPFAGSAAALLGLSGLPVPMPLPLPLPPLRAPPKHAAPVPGASAGADSAPRKRGRADETAAATDMLDAALQFAARSATDSCRLGASDDAAAMPRTERSAFEWLDALAECAAHNPALGALFDARDLDVSAALLPGSAAAYARGAAIARSQAPLSVHEFADLVLSNPFFRDTLCPVYAESAAALRPRKMCRTRACAPDRAHDIVCALKNAVA